MLDMEAFLYISIRKFPYGAHGASRFSPLLWSLTARLGRSKHRNCRQILPRGPVRPVGKFPYRYIHKSFHFEHLDHSSVLRIKKLPSALRCPVTLRWCLRATPAHTSFVLRVHCLIQGAPCLHSFTFFFFWAFAMHAFKGVRSPVLLSFGCQ